MHVGSDEPPSPSARPGHQEQRAVVRGHRVCCLPPKELLRAGLGMSTYSLADLGASNVGALESSTLFSF